MPLPLEKTEKKYTYEDYVTWPDDERWEIIDGVPYNMSPAPTLNHQDITGNFYRILGNSLEGKPCKAFISPADVVLSKNNVVQPDVFVVCDKSKITKANLQGAPDLVIEVLSPSTSLKDKREKKAAYEKYGVKEYITIDPVGKFVERFYLGEDGKYRKADLLGCEETIKLLSLNEMEIPLNKVFEEEIEA